MKKGLTSKQVHCAHRILFKGVSCRRSFFDSASLLLQENGSGRIGNNLISFPKVGIVKEI